MNLSTQLFATMSPNRLFLRCALPSMIAMAVSSLYTVADGIFVGRFLGEEALAAVNLVMPFLLISFVFPDLIAVGSSVQIALRLGEKKEEEASRIFTMCSLLIVVLSCLIGLAGFLGAEAMLQILGADAAVAALEEGKVIFFAGGTGHPYFSTDTGAVLRAIEIEADTMLLAKAIDGIYDSDPKVNPEAKKYDELSIQDIIDQKLAAVDLTASILCLENKMPMLVFGLNEENSIVETMSGTFTGTKVTV